MHFFIRLLPLENILSKIEKKEHKNSPPPKKKIKMKPKKIFIVCNLKEEAFVIDSIPYFDRTLKNNFYWAYLV